MIFTLYTHIFTSACSDKHKLDIENSTKDFPQIELGLRTMCSSLNDEGSSSSSSSLSLLQQTDETFPLAYFLLDFITGRGDLSLCGEHGTDEGEDGAAQRRIERPAQRAKAEFIR